MKTLEQMKQSPRNNFPEVIVVHHTGGTNANPLLDTSNQTFKIIQDYHISLGWENIGYHWVIEKNGKVVEGRPEHYYGAHTKEQDMNTKSIGTCLVGNFDATLPTKEQENALVGLIRAIQGRYPNITNDKIVPHRKYANKTCFGKLLPNNYAQTLLATPPDPKDKIREAIAILQSLVV